MSRRIFTIAFVISVLFSAGISQFGSEKPVYSLAFNYTVPTRTPEPEPTTRPTSSNPHPSQPSTTETPVPTPTATETAVPVVTFAATPIGGFVATAEPCDEQPTILSVNTLRVRSGPGTDYDIVGELVYLEVRPIIGRASNSAWWQIIPADGETGWVADEIVAVQGNISVVPLVAAPPLNGIMPTVGPVWDPTVVPDCPSLPMWTSTPAPTVPPTETNTPVPPTETPQPTDTAVPPTDTPPADTATPPPQIPTPIPTALPLDVQTQSTGIGFLPIAALILLASGGIVVYLRRNRD